MFRDEELLKELNEAQIKNKERLENEKQDDDDKNEDYLYRLNIRDTTPEMMKENVVIPNEKYNNFFDFEAIKEL